LNQGKQRLAEGSNAESALAIAQALLACAVEDANNWDGPVVIACSNNSDVEWAQSLIEHVQVIAQLPEGREGNLGDRLNYVDEQLRAQGHQQIVIIGTDSPILSEQHFESALTSLKHNDIVLSHADDGGVIIMANKKPWPLLRHLPWSTNELSHTLSQKCQQSHLKVEYSLSGYDVDYVNDLKKLLIDLQTDKRPARQALLNKINEFFSQPKVNSQAN
jgi:glycosyltransferase A (GT-A) superfamily protein (DUF2064 family)